MVENRVHFSRQESLTVGGETLSDERGFEVEASLLVNEGGLHCVPVVFVRPLGGGAVELGEESLLGGVPVVALDAARAARRGAGLLAFVLEDPMDARRFRPGDVVRLHARPPRP